MGRVAGAQQRDSVSLFYGFNQTQPLNGFSRVDSMLAKHEGKVEAVYITGYADFVFTPAYNLVLSKQRADAVKNYIIKTAVSGIRIISSQGRGEAASAETGSKLGQPAQRRVDVTCVLTQPVKTKLPEDGKKKLGEAQIQVEPPQPDETVGETETPAEAPDLPALEKGNSLTLQGLSFIPGRHVLLKSSIPVLEKLYKTLKENPGLRIEIQGHVCCADGQADGLDYDTYQPNLSLGRAKAVYDYLIYKGIDAARLRYKGFGHSRPKVAPERSEADEQANRRVEIMVLE